MSHRTAVLEQLRNANPVPMLDAVSDDDLELVRAIVIRGRSPMTNQIKDRHHAEVERRSTSWLRPALVVVLAAVLLLGTLGTALMILGGGDDDVESGQPTPGPTIVDTPLEEESPPTAGPTHATDMTATTVPALAIGPSWTRVSTSDAVFGAGFVTNIAAFDDEFLAVGTLGEDCAADAAQCRATVWRSTDGVNWDQVFRDGPAGEGIGTWMWDVVKTEGRYLAMGEFVGPNVLAQEPLLVRSVDGADWEQLDPTGIVLDGARLRALVALEDGYLVAGQSCEARCNATIWTSADGSSWTKVLDPPAENSSIVALEFVGDRYLAVGNAGIDEGIDVAMIWSSEDGVSWTEVPADPGVFGATAVGPDRGHWQARAAAAGGPGYVVVGAEFETGGVVWLSADGVTWTQAPREPFIGAALNGVVEVDGEIIVVGAIGGIDIPNLAVAWRSSDGINWSRYDIDANLTGADSSFWQLAARGSVAIGALDVDGRATVWVINLDG